MFILNRRAFLFVCIVFVLVGCGGNAESVSTQTPAPTATIAVWPTLKIVPTETAPPTAEPTETPNSPQTPIAAVVPESSEVVDDIEAAQESAYTEFLTDAGGNLAEALNKFGELNIEVGEHPALFSDERWMMEIGMQTAFIGSQSECFIDYPFENVPPRFVASHAKFVEASVLFRDSMGIYRSAVDKRDVELFIEASEMIREATELFFVDGGMLLP